MWRPGLSLYLAGSSSFIDGFGGRHAVFPSRDGIMDPMCMGWEIDQKCYQAEVWTVDLVPIEDSTVLKARD
jgi:hypothetical protein